MSWLVPHRRQVGPTGPAVALALSSAAILFCLVVGEIAARLLLPSASLWRYPNLTTLRAQYNPVVSPHIRYDGELGHEPVPSSEGWLFGAPVSYTADGIRRNGLLPSPSGPPVVLAVGDSTTEGWGVGNDGTWPAQLERDTGWRVLNAGVRAYGLDQIVLRAERLAPRFDPQFIVLAFIADDIYRSGLAVRHGIHKPYFVPVGDGLALRNVPVPTERYSHALDPVRRILGYSELLNFAMLGLGLEEYWLVGDAPTGAAADLVTCRLMDRFALLVRRRGSKGLVVGLPSDPRSFSAGDMANQKAGVAAALSCADKAGLATLDTHDAFVAAGIERDHDAFFFDFHLTNRGNGIAARLIASTLEGAEH